jgi:integrase
MPEGHVTPREPRSREPRPSPPRHRGAEIRLDIAARGFRHGPATITTTVAAASCVFRHEVERNGLKVNPVQGVSLPAPRKGRDHVVGAVAAAAILEALPERDRALWPTAMYAGLRRGELRALRVSDVDLTTCVIHVERSFDDKDGVGQTKGRTTRPVPVPSLLCQRLREHLMRTGRRGDELLFGTMAHNPFSPSRLTERADKAWKHAGLARLTLHEARHCYAGYMIAAGVNAKALSTYMGHASIAITLDTYGHMLPGNEEEAATLLDAYLDRSTGVASV